MFFYFIFIFIFYRKSLEKKKKKKKKKGLGLGNLTEETQSDSGWEREPFFSLFSFFFLSSCSSLTSCYQKTRTNENLPGIMNHDSKRSNPAPLMVKPESEDRKPSSAAPVGKKIVIKSADMFGDMQKEAVDISIAVSDSFSWNNYS